MEILRVGEDLQLKVIHSKTNIFFGDHVLNQDSLIKCIPPFFGGNSVSQ